MNEKLAFVAAIVMGIAVCQPVCGQSAPHLPPRISSSGSPWERMSTRSPARQANARSFADAASVIGQEIGRAADYVNLGRLKKEIERQAEQIPLGGPEREFRILWLHNGENLFTSPGRQPTAYQGLAPVRRGPAFSPAPAVRPPAKRPRGCCLDGGSICVSRFGWRLGPCEPPSVKESQARSPQ